MRRSYWLCIPSVNLVYGYGSSVRSAFEYFWVRLLLSFQFSCLKCTMRHVKLSSSFAVLTTTMLTNRLGVSPEINLHYKIFYMSVTQDYYLQTNEIQK